MPSANALLKHRYRILASLGVGGFGAVYKAEDTEFGNRLVAVKEMSESGLSVHELIEASEAFKHEAFLLAGLVYPNLPSIYDYFTEQGHWYIVMDFIEGETLEDHLQKSPTGYLPVEEVLDIGIQLCSVLDYLHTRKSPIIFRDLKPANIMLTPGGTIYLIDFGVARHFKPGKASDTIAFGSPGYAAPEQYGKAQTTAHADIYSLGVTFYQLLAGVDPTLTPFQFAPLQSSCRQPVPAELHTLIMQMLELDERKRPDTMRAVRQELQHIAVRLAAGLVSYVKPVAPSGGLISQPQQIQPVSSLPTWGSLLYTYREHTYEVRTLAWSPNGESIASAGNDCAVRVWRPTVGSGTYFTYRNHSDWVYAVAWSPDGRRIASASGDHTVQVWSPTANRNWRKNLALHAGFHALRYNGHTSKVYSVSWSLDGQCITSASNDHTVHVWDAVTGNTILTQQHADVVWSVQWSPNGRYIASTSNDHTVRIWDALTGRNAQVVHTSTSVAHALAWSPDSRYIVIGVSDHTAQIWEVATGRKVLSYKSHTGNVICVAWSPDGQRIASGSTDSTVEMWEAATGKSLFTYRSNSNSARAVAWSPDNLRLAYTSNETIVDVWQVK
ncbi:MAG: hypothetical protein NVSMB27_23720 [Ktedonobacteraceae bacterium]